MPTYPNVPVSPTTASAPSGRLRRALNTLLVGVSAIALSLGTGLAPAAATGTATITVHVQDATNGDVPLAWANVILDPPEGDSSWLNADATGTLVISDLPAGDYRITAGGGDYSWEHRDLVVAEGGSYELTIGAWITDAGIHGRVTSAGGDPLEGVSVSVSRGDGFSEDYTDEDGDFAIADLAPGNYTVRFSLWHYEIKELTVILVNAEDKEVNATLDAIPLGTVAGTVKNTSGTPLAGITVSAQRWNGTEWEGMMLMQTLSDGTYSMEVPAGSDYTLLIWQDGGPYESTYLGGALSIEAAPRFDVAVGAVVTKNIVLSKGGTISGHISLATPDGHVDYNPPSWPGPKVYRLTGGVWTLVEVPSSFAGCCDEGDFQVFGLHPGTYKIGFIDSVSGPRAFRTAYWKSGTTSGTATLAGATSFTVSAGKNSTGKSITILMPKPGYESEPLDDSALTPDLEDDIDAVDESNQGDTITVDVGENRAGEWVSVWAHSEPTALTDDWVQVDSHGKVKATLDYDLPAGEHDLVVQFADGNAAGWTPIEVGEAGIHRTFTSVSTPVISGSVKVGATLTAKVGTSKPTAAHYSYQWYVDASPMPLAIEGATGATFVPGLDELGKKLKVTVTRDKLGYDDVTKISATSAAVGLGTLKTVKPVVLGTRKVEQLLTVSPSGWTPGDTAFSYQWLRNGVAIPGAVDPVYGLTPDDYAKIITVKVRGTRDGYAPASATSSSEVAKVAAAPMFVPTSITVDPPTVGVSGSYSQDGPFGPGVVKYAYQWYVGSTKIDGATKYNYTPTGSTAGKTLKLKITISAKGYLTKSITSAPSAVVQPGTFAHPPEPALGAPRVGASITAPTAGWFPAPTSFGYQWLLDGAPIAGATSSKYKPAASQYGHLLSVVVTGKRTGYTTASLTTAQAEVGLGIFDVQPKPTISGTKVPHRTLTASAGTWAPSGATFSYQWLLNGAPIDGAYSKTYVVQPLDVDGAISVAVTASKAVYASASKTSSASTVKGIDYANCTALNLDYPSGVARSESVVAPGAFVSLALYNLNDESDADHDGWACEG